MKKDIHPENHEIKISCNCGFSFKTFSAKSGDLNLEVCSQCHPFFTGKQKLVDTSGRVEKFRRKFATNS